MTIQELMEKRAKVWEAAKNFVDTNENENGVLSAEDSAAYERMEAEIEDLTKAIDRHRKAEEMEKTLTQPVNQPPAGAGESIRSRQLSTSSSAAVRSPAASSVQKAAAAAINTGKFRKNAGL